MVIHNFLGKSYIMSCSHSVTTKTGTFTVYTELVSKCEAEKRCRKRGEMLAPVTNFRDSAKLLELFATHETCDISNDVLISYWLDLEISYAKDMSSSKKTFSNGVKWRAKKHNQIYDDYNKKHTDNAFAILTPFHHYMYGEKAYGISSLSSDACRKFRYVCLKPAEKASAEPIERRDDEVEGVFIPSNVAFLIILAMVLCVCVCMKTIRRLKTEVSVLKQKGVFENDALTDMLVQK